MKAARSGPQKMKSYSGFSEWKKDQNPANQKLIGLLRRLVNGCSKSLEERVKWGNGCWVKGEAPVVYIHALDEGVQLGFFGGSKLEDPKKRLEGKGQFIRFIVIRSKADIDVSYFSSLVKNAIRNSRPK